MVGALSILAKRMIDCEATVEGFTSEVKSNKNSKKEQRDLSDMEYNCRLIQLNTSKETWWLQMHLSLSIDIPT